MSGVGDSQRRALLIDLFDTVVATDFDAIENELTAAIGCTRADLLAHLRVVGSALMTTNDGYEQFFAGLLASIGRPVSDAVLAELLELDRTLLVRHSRVLDDARELLDHARAAGRPIALVSNCAPNARAVVDQLGISQWVDEVVLSCDVGTAKPAAAIFAVACERLGVDPREADFVDDQAKYCIGAAAVGLDAYWVVRDGSTPEVPAVQGPGSVSLVTSCLDLVSRVD